MAEAHAQVIRLRAQGCSFRRISIATGYHHSTCHAIVRRHLDKVGPSQEDLDGIRSSLYNELQMVKELLVPHLMTEDEDGSLIPPNIPAFQQHRLLADRQARLYGLY